MAQGAGEMGVAAVDSCQRAIHIAALLGEFGFISLQPIQHAAG